ncbi:leucine-tRNA ligase (LARS1) [Vairimorpha necatrix]|uniref:leucine--tRNA ligase n=1 Tax=Vairimorpha necatrix TaxID=6039 RepID=A0AAX4JBN3_9MICR
MSKKTCDLNKENIELNRENDKLNYLNKLEKNRIVKSEISEKQKFFVTFPYPYMNGKLHLGHLFSISKSDFESYYKELQGYNVLFPLGFHCTGMPIAALAKKLKDELNGQKTDISTKDIIQSLGFDNVEPFTDPIHWIKTFPKLCINSLKNFGANIDWRRSFITTDINKYYDSFIRWQFYKLKNLGYLSFGKRYSIFCPIDNQACLDHDRRKGENLKPIQQILYKFNINEKILLCRYKNEGKPIKLVIGENLRFISFKYKEKIFISEKIIFDNLKYQVSNIEYLEELNLKKNKDFAIFFNDLSINVEFVEKDLFVVKTELSENFRFAEDLKFLKDAENQSSNIENDIKNLSIEDKLIQTDKFVSVYIPEGEVISRSGGICVVSLLDQWYIDYSNENWKNKVKKCLKNMECESDTRSKLEEGVDWINKWAFSRSFGLGTRIPWDDQYLIDSLSDSTIYMAFYTVKNFLFEDLEGVEEIFPSKLLSNDVWDYIFMGKDLIPELSEYSELLSKCKKSFEYFYPVDLRVSGKDLIKNHLLFFMFNHVAIFDEKYWPRRIFTNGHLMLNSEKMSKSTGNFLTVDDALARYGKSATRMCLAVCGDTNEDANFIESNANSYVLKIFNFIKSIEDEFNNSDNSSKNVDIFLLETLSFNIKECIRAYDIMKYSDVVKYGFFEMSHLISLYKVLRGTNSSLIRQVHKSMTQLLYPIMPDFCRYLLDKYFDSDFNLPTIKLSTDKMISSIEYLKDLTKKINLSKIAKNKSKVKILVGDKYPEWKLEIMRYIDESGCPRDESIKKDKELINEILRDIKTILERYNINIKKGNIFLMDYIVYPEKYIKKFNEYEIIKEFKFYIEDISGKEVTVEEDGESEPFNPQLKFY